VPSLVDVSSSNKKRTLESSQQRVWPTSGRWWWYGSIVSDPQQERDSETRFSTQGQICAILFAPACLLPPWPSSGRKTYGSLLATATWPGSLSSSTSTARAQTLRTSSRTRPCMFFARSTATALTLSQARRCLLQPPPCAPVSHLQG
jgi:hypothetical protein